MNKKYKETDEGVYEWVQSPDGVNGYWSLLRDQKMLEYRMPFYCTACNSALYNWDKSFWNRWGVCSNCYISHLEDRPNLPEFKSNEERARFVKQKIEEKNKSE